MTSEKHIVFQRNLKREEDPLAHKESLPYKYTQTTIHLSSHHTQDFKDRNQQISLKYKHIIIVQW